MEVVKHDVSPETLLYARYLQEGAKRQTSPKAFLDSDLDPHLFFLRKRLCFENNSKGHKHLEAIRGNFLCKKY